MFIINDAMLEEFNDWPKIGIAVPKFSRRSSELYSKYLILKQPNDKHCNRWKW